MYLEKLNDNSGNIRLLSPTIFRRIVNIYPNVDVRIVAGDSYGIDCRGTDLGDGKIIGVDIVGYKN